MISVDHPFAELIEQAHRDVDYLRKIKGLPPVEWKLSRPKPLKTIVEQIVKRCCHFCFRPVHRGCCVERREYQKRQLRKRNGRL